MFTALPRRSRRLLQAIAGALIALASLFVPRLAHAFCGFYVSGADAALYSDATQVVMMREGTRTVLAMQNQYKGPPQDFAMVVPVPVVLRQDQVKTLPRDVFERVDALGAPRLVEYWEQDPCSALSPFGALGSRGGGVGFGNGHGRLGGGESDTVKIEAQFEVGEYEIVILSAQDSTGLDTWLRQNNYKIPANAEPLLRPYVASGSKFFVAKVNVAKAKLVDDPSLGPGQKRADLSPLRFHYDSPELTLPVRLGLLNSNGTQDLIITILAPNTRYAVANYPNVTIPTNFDVADSTRASFPAFYAALFDKTIEKNPGAVVTEYAWGAGSCDPCPSTVQGLGQKDLATLGADALPSAHFGPITGHVAPQLRQGNVTVNGRLPPEVIQRIVRQNFGRFRLCYENGLRTNPALHGNARVSFKIDPTGAVQQVRDAGSDLPDPATVACVVRGFGNLSFPSPENGSTVDVTFPINFDWPGAASAGAADGGVPYGLVSIASFDLTRLHVRYGKDSLGSDLVFAKAPPITGGRENFSERNVIEHGATQSTSNNFQARYVIRHPWKGPISCKEPHRGEWGGPPNGNPSNTITAIRLGSAPRGGVTLASFLGKGTTDADLTAGSAFADLVAPTPTSTPTTNAAPSIDASTSSSAMAPPTDDASTGAGVPAEPPSRCGCRVGAYTRSEIPLFFSVAIVIGAIARRQRKT